MLFLKKAPFDLFKIHVRVYRYQFKALPEYTSELDHEAIESLFKNLFIEFSLFIPITEL